MHPLLGGLGGVDLKKARCQEIHLQAAVFKRNTKELTRVSRRLPTRLKLSWSPRSLTGSSNAAVGVRVTHSHGYGWQFVSDIAVLAKQAIHRGNFHTPYIVNLIRTELNTRITSMKGMRRTHGEKSRPLFGSTRKKPKRFEIKKTAVNKGLTH